MSLFSLYLEEVKKTTYHFSNYTKPDWDDEFGEIERTVEEILYKDQPSKIQKAKAKEILSKFKRAKSVVLTDSIWDNLENTDSNSLKIGDYKKSIALSKKYGRTIEWIFDAIKNNKQIPMPQILSTNGRYILVGGNTRLMAFRVMGINPKVVLLTL